MKIATLLGTSRPGNYTQHALRIAEDELTQLGAQVARFDPAGKRLPFPGEEGDFPAVEELDLVIRDAAGVLIATPEYHGSMPAMLKLILENMGFPSALAAKPVALLGVAAGRIGAIKTLEQVRSVGAHTGAIMLPSPISIAGINGVFDSDGQCKDPDAEKSIRRIAHTLMDYMQQAVCPRVSLEAMMRGAEAREQTT